MAKHRNKSGVRRGVYILPNIVTTASLFCGFYSIICSVNGHHWKAAWLILLAGIFDAMDGRIARLTRTYSDFGTEYDSLCDLASFGLAPVVLAYTWSLNYFQKFGWAAAFLFFCCGALRLARYNVQIDNVEKRYFQGLPIPVAAYVLASYVIFHIQWKGELAVASYLLLFMTIGLALLMVSNVRYQSLKSLNLKSRGSFLALVGIAIALFIIASAPSEMIFVFSLLYVVSGLVETLFHQTKSRRQRRQAARIASGEAGPAQEPLRVLNGNR